MNLNKILSEYNVLISYRPLKDEVNFLDLKQFKLYKNIIIFIPNNNTEDPFILADRLAKLNLNNKVCLIIPGQIFDIFGNRRGRGCGWYDRFLSSVPKNWYRIGIIEKLRLSNNKIDTNPWDEPVDLVVSVNKSSKSIKIYRNDIRK